MKHLVWGSQFYTFLRECEKSNLEKTVLDLGAGGDLPPLGLFHLFGYKTYGIDITEKQLELASEFCKTYDINLNIRKGNMIELKFDDESISFVYSINSMIFLTKKETQKVIQEIERVLKVNGLCFVNFLSIDDENYTQGRRIGDDEFVQGDFDWTEKEVVQSFFKDDEPDKFFKNFEILRKEKKIIERKCENCNNIHKQSFIDYLAKKK